MAEVGYLKRILTARVYDVAERTPLDRAPNLSARLGNGVWLKREDLQPVFSFKLRGAYNRMAHLDAEARARGVICSSAGNHAQGVALAGSRLGVRAVIVMPVTTPRIKVEAVRRLGGEIVLHGEAYDEAFGRACEIAAAEGLEFIHPFDDPLVIAGQGTIGMEIMGQHPGGRIDCVFVPIGGGGLAAGVATYIKALAPQTRVIGVEPVDAASMQAAFAAGEPVTLAHVGIFADGVAVRRVGDETFRLCRAYLDDIITVDTDQICAATRDIFEETRSVVEPAGALAVAGLKRYVAAQGLVDQELVAINCGANVNFDRLRHIAERASIGEQQEMLLAVEIPERRGSFLAFCEALGTRNVTEFSYRYGDATTARLFVGLELRGRSDRDEVLATLTARGYRVADLSDDELTKVHIRYMVGGAGRDLGDERLLRFEFPEKPGALMRFLQVVGGEWNITLFHYRNHGSEHGRVLTAVQVPPETADSFASHLDQLAYPCWEESANPAWREFLLGEGPSRRAGA